jgi:hypothetical protein
MPTIYGPGVTLLRRELTAILDDLDAAATIDAEDELLEELAAWADARLGHGWEPLYDGVPLVEVTGRWMGHPLTLDRL